MEYWKKSWLPKGPRSNLDHERTKGSRSFERTRRPKTHWDQDLEEMALLSKDIESERKWKLAQAKKVEIRANQATRSEKRVKHSTGILMLSYKFDQKEEKKLSQLALNISKDVKVLVEASVQDEDYVLQPGDESEYWKKPWLPRGPRRSKLRKNLAVLKRIGTMFLRDGQFFKRYVSTLRENLVNSPTLCKSSNLCPIQEQPTIHQKGGEVTNKKAFESDTRPQSTVFVQDEDYDLQPGGKSESWKKSWLPKDPGSKLDHERTKGGRSSERTLSVLKPIGTMFWKRWLGCQRLKA
ncbi:protein PHOTOPERIOD-INDEPENDENT EARLY FLOWERING 1 [Sesamum angolense]|uniref:Protein PHOTOPERIOD-INDEPENDENT EARLY FLOWERING 1 n=1 Tax=Sesamum angolense TaxID=2727404 RepID=A0AAE1WBL8_9LAMI|nr:protein PHOTOPERIOD-INDEPENDENT EARLY FLOWERING 1 [Sesamum angolense]